MLFYCYYDLHYALKQHAAQRSHLVLIPLSVLSLQPHIDGVAKTCDLSSGIYLNSFCSLSYLKITTWPRSFFYERYIYHAGLCGMFRYTSVIWSLSGYSMPFAEQGTHFSSCFVRGFCILLRFFSRGSCGNIANNTRNWHETASSKYYIRFIQSLGNLFDQMESPYDGQFVHKLTDTLIRWRVKTINDSKTTRSEKRKTFEIGLWAQKRRAQST